jgi:hypothetical protein
MGLLDSIRSEQDSTHTGPQCSICKLLTELDAKDRADLQTALDDLSLFGTVIARALKKSGHEVTQYQVQRHRRTDCIKK